MKAPVLELALLTTLAFGTVSCGRSHGAASDEETSPRAVKVTVVSSSREPARLELSGQVVSRNRFELASKAAGRVVELRVTEGDRVERGQVLARVDAPELIAAAAQTRAAQEASRLEWEAAVRQAERFRRLAGNEIVTPRDLELAEVAEAGAKARHEGAKAMSRAGQANLEYATLRAPMNGVVVRRLARVGDLATPGRPLLVLEEAGEQEVRLTFPADLDWPVAPGQKAEVMVHGQDIPFAGVVDRVAPSAEHHTIEAYLRVENLEATNGTFVRAVLLGNEQVESIRVPAEALVYRGPLTGVFAVQNGRASLRWLRLSPDGRVQAGLTEGDSVILAPPAVLESGDPVEASR